MPLSKTQKQITSFVQSCFYYGKFIPDFSDCAAPRTDTRRKNLPSNVVHIGAAKAAFKTLKSRMISASILLIRKMGYEADFFVATDASKAGIVGGLLQEDTSGYLRPCAYWAKNLTIVKQGIVPMTVKH
jgi:hypothetical protein